MYTMIVSKFRIETRILATREVRGRLLPAFEKGNVFNVDHGGL